MALPPPPARADGVYRALAHHFELFLQLYEERFERTHGYQRRCVQVAV